ncbi:ABC transporter ATP-binding protein [Streptomyces stramineus]
MDRKTGREEDRSARGAVAAMFRLTAAHRSSMTVATVLTLVGSALGLAQPLLAKKIVDAAGSGRITWPLLFLACLFLAEAATAAVGRFVLERMGERIVRGLRRGLVGHLLRLEMREYDKHRTGDLISRVTADTSLLREVVSQALVDLVTGSLVAVGAVALMIWIDPLLLLLVTLTVVTAAAIVTSLLAGIRAAAERMQHAVGEIAADLERALGALPMVRVHRAEEREAARIGQCVDTAYEAGVRTARLASVMSPAVELAVHGSFLLVLVIGGMRVNGHANSLGDLVAFLLYATYLVVPLSSVFRAVGLIQRGMGAFQRIEEALALQAEPTGPARETPADPSPRPGRPRTRPRTGPRHPGRGGHRRGTAPRHPPSPWRTCGSATARTARSCKASPCPCRTGDKSPWSAARAPARARSSPSSPASTKRTPEPCCSTAYRPPS